MKKRLTNEIARKTWIAHHGPIPFDQFDCRMEIHHIDGNRDHNEIDNLICLSIHEHFEIHFWQEDWAACQNIVIRMSITPAERSALASEFAHRRLAAGTHHFTDPEFIKADSARKRINRLGPLNPMFGVTRPKESRDRQSDVLKKQVAAGTHHLQTNHPSKIQASCIMCRRSVVVSHLMGKKPVHHHNESDPTVSLNDSKRKVSCIDCGKTTNCWRLFSEHLHER